MRRCLAAVAVTGTALAVTAIGSPAWAGSRSADQTAAQSIPMEKIYGGYETKGECEYWRGGVDPGGQNSSPCFQGDWDRWFFIHY